MLTQYLYIRKRIDASKSNGALGGRPKKPSLNPPTLTTTPTKITKTKKKDNFPIFWKDITNKVSKGIAEKNFKNVPFLSELFGKNVEESLLAADFKVKKNGNKTDFIFNPLSILTPGKTRNFFDIWE